MQCLRTARRTPCPISPGAKPSEEWEDDSEEEHTPRGHGLVGADRAQHYLFLGWRNDVADMVAYLDEIAPHGSTLTIAAQLPLDERELQMNADGRHRRDGLQNLTLTHIVETVVSRHALELDGDGTHVAVRRDGSAVRGRVRSGIVGARSSMQWWSLKAV